jgi:hypothetical protein
VAKSNAFECALTNKQIMINLFELHFQRLDLVLVNSEVTFAGSDTPANMIKAIDTTMNSLRGTYGIASSSNCIGKLKWNSDILFHSETSKVLVFF